MTILRIQTGDFDPGRELARLEALGGGAVASFTGLVRGDGGLVEMRLEHYPGMTEKRIREIADAARGRWALIGLTIVHRIGSLRPGERIVLVAAASRHRKDALAACEYLMDFLKSAAPFWKKERFADGSERWVEARAGDEDAMRAWD